MNRSEVTLPQEFPAKEGVLLPEGGRYRAIFRVEDEKLQDREELFRSIFWDSPVGIELYNARGVLQRVNPACLDIFGILDASEISQFNLFDDPNLSHVHKGLLRRGKRIRYEAPFDFDRVKDAGLYRTRRSGTIFLDVVITPTAQGGYLVQVQEVTERRRAEDALRVAKLRQEAAVTGGGVGLWDWDMATGTVWYSPEWKRQVGCEDHEVGGGFEEWENRVHPQDLESVLGEIRGCLEGMKPSFEAEFRFRHKDGSWRWILARASFLRDTRGRPLRTCGTHLDITERKLAEMARKELEERLTQSQKMESVGRLAGGIAHDFNNMLNVILGHAELLQGDLAPSDPAAESIREIRKAAEHSADLTRQLLAFARRQAALPRVLDLNESMTGMLSMLSRLIGEDVSLSWNPGVPLWAVRVDPTQIHQILANLCVNARDAVPEGGSITIRTRNVTIGEEESLRNPALRPGEFVVLTVADDGVGIPQEVLKHIFEPFFTTKDLKKGTGLGLATVYGIAKQNDGFVDVESTPEVGTTLRVYLPRFQDPGGEEAKAEVTEKEAPPEAERQLLTHR